MKTFNLYRIDTGMGMMWFHISSHDSYTYEEALQFFSPNMNSGQEYIITIRK